MLAYLFRFAAIPRAARAFLAGGLLLELGHAFLWTLQNLYVRSVGYGEAQAGIVLSAQTVGILLATFPSAWMYDRFGPRRSLTLACCLAAFGMTGLALSTSLPWMLGFAALNGAAFCLHMVVAAPFVMSVSDPTTRTQLFSAEFATRNVAMTIGPLVGGYVAGTFEASFVESASLRYTLLLGAALMLSGTLFYRRVPPAFPSDQPRRRRSLFEILHRDNRHMWLRLSIPNLLVGLGAGLSIPFINLYFTDRFDVQKAHLGLLMAAASATMTVGVLATPWAIARMGFVRATILTEVLSLPFFVVMAWTTSFPLAVGAMILRSALMNLSHPIWRNFVMEITPESWRASVNSMATLAWNAGWGISTIFGGALIESTTGLLGDGVDGYAFPMIVTMALYVAAITTEGIFFWAERQRGRSPSI